MNIDEIAWRATKGKDLWIFDKFIVATKLNYKCGAKGVDVLDAKEYMVKPCINFMGMGDGSSFTYLKDNTDHLPPGSFWCEVFKGRHLSVDYDIIGKQVLCVEGFRSDLNNTKRWDRWEKVSDNIPYPEILKELEGDYPLINVEFIGDKIIEIHLRGNPDFDNHDSNYVIPIWKGDVVMIGEGEKFIKDEEAERVGFIIKDTDV